MIVLVSKHSLLLLAGEWIRRGVRREQGDQGGEKSTMVQAGNGGEVSSGAAGAMRRRGLTILFSCLYFRTSAGHRGSMGYVTP